VGFGCGVVGVDGLGLGVVGLELLGFAVGAEDDELDGAVCSVVAPPVVVLGAGTVAEGAAPAVVDGAGLDEALAAEVLEPPPPPRDIPPHPDSAVVTASTPAARTVVERSRFWCMVSLSSAHAGTPARTEPRSW
jgi:hypothetical protein